MKIQNYFNKMKFNKKNINFILIKGWNNKINFKFYIIKIRGYGMTSLNIW